MRKTSVLVLCKREDICPSCELIFLRISGINVTFDFSVPIEYISFTTVNSSFFNARDKFFRRASSPNIMICKGPQIIDYTITV